MSGIPSSDEYIFKTEPWFYKEGATIDVHYHKDLLARNLKTLPTFAPGMAGKDLTAFTQTRFGPFNTAIKAFIVEIPPGGKRKVTGMHRHYMEAVIYIPCGEGYSEIWREGGRKYKFRWQEGSIWSPPFNWHHDHYNTSPDKPARYLAIINEHFMDLHVGGGIVRHSDHSDVPKDYEREVPYDPKKTQTLRGKRYGFPAAARGICFSDIRSLPLKPWPEQGGSALFLDLAENRTIATHVAEIPPGASEKKAHRHYYESFVYILSGQGYTLIGKGDESKKRYDWAEGDFLSIPLNHWHQHFNSSTDKPVRYFEANNRPMMEKLFDPGFIFKDN
ncbi:MAG: cupin domain-containing protein [Deltaproteobacteria bacterium]|nr:cupin domain-containing protein [Deltaproteobacteria bacterium]